MSNAVAPTVGPPRAAQLDHASPRTGEWTREAFSREVAPLIPGLFRLCLTLADTNEEAEDLLQSALTKAFLHRHSFRSESALLGWLYGIARHEHAAHVRSRARRRGLVREALDRFGELFSEWSQPEQASPESWLLSDEDSTRLLAAVRSISEPYRAVVWMCDIEEMGYDEVARALDVPVGTVKSRHARGRAQLRLALDNGSHGAKP
jgi:RNA polymerase sigma-70 factor (ECF subfamily)